MSSTYLIKPYLKRNWHLLLLGFLSLVLVDLLQLIIPRILKRIIDDLTIFSVDSVQLFHYAGWIVIIAVFIAGFRYVWRSCLSSTSRLVEEGLRNRLFSHLLTLSPAYYNRTKTGDLMAHSTNDLMHIRMAMGMGLVALIDSVVLGITAIGFMVYINVNLTLFALIPMPLIIISAKVFSRRMHHMYGKVQASFSDLTEAARERFAGIRIIKAYSLHEDEREAFSEISEEYISKNMGLVRITGAFNPMMMFFTNLSLCFVVYLGGHQTIGHTITPGDFVAFISYLALLTWPMMAIGWLINLIQRGAASLDRIDRILQTQPDIGDSPGALAMPDIKGDIKFDQVLFSYHSYSQPALDRISFSIPAGGTFGIVGPPGSGKTSLLYLIPRMFEVTDGTILVDCKDIRSMRLDDLRSHISFAPQEPYLFSGTIRENITFNDPSIREDDLMQAVEDACLYETVQSFANGFDTHVGEKGVTLSGGQKQRIGLARALIRKNPILILDDPISQVDAETGDRIVDAIESRAGERTVIIVSHRLSAVHRADNILVLEKGKIVESGSHSELMDMKKYYARTYRLQELEEKYNV
ncbi:MAG: ABC transporter ATP-binding protein [Deltaproteobacteria bacterium]|nr:ABC transporter ATP-binding protein [Deltaproteobacteria bacterium]MBW1914966.1 ABC transporter ATP-binding protein [Deltaproteobacteria bacterium]